MQKDCSKLKMADSPPKLRTRDWIHFRWRAIPKVGSGWDCLKAAWLGIEMANCSSFLSRTQMLKFYKYWHKLMVLSWQCPPMALSNGAVVLCTPLTTITAYPATELTRWLQTETPIFGYIPIAV